jgi:hypothetical protein
MKVSIKGKQYTMVAIASETVEVEKTLINNKLVKAFVYVYDKDRKAYKFLAEEIERYD